MTVRPLVLALVVAQWGCASSRYAEIQGENLGSGGDLVGKRVQGSLPTLGSYELVDLTRYQGQAVAMVVWNSASLNSREALPFFTTVTEQYRNRALVVGINVDADYREAEETKQRFALNFPILRDAGGELTRGMGLTRLPSTLVLDAEGRVMAIHEGYDERVGADIVASLDDSIRHSARQRAAMRQRSAAALVAQAPADPGRTEAAQQAPRAAAEVKPATGKASGKGKVQRKARRGRGRR